MSASLRPCSLTLYDFKKYPMMKNKYRILISGGGTGGNIFPALSIANALRRRLDTEILFVGADDRMEMERIPAAGYPIKGLPVAGFDRKHLLRNFGVLLKLRKSLAMARRSRRILLRPDSESRPEKRCAYSDSGAELLCRCDQ